MALPALPCVLQGPWHLSEKPLSWRSPRHPHRATGALFSGAVAVARLAPFGGRFRQRFRQRCSRPASDGSEFSPASLETRTVKELKKMCKERKLQVKGKKGDLIHRLLQFTDSMDPAAASAVALQREEKNEVDELYTQAQRELHSLQVNDLRDLCEERGLSSEGSKVDLVKRLAAHQASSSLEPSVPSVPAVQRSVPSPEERITKALSRGSEQDLRQVVQDIFEVGRPKPGEIVTGVVTSIVEWGAFVELDKDGWSALIHISEISDTFIENIEEYICPGQRVEALVLQSPVDRMDRLSLSIRRLKDLQRYDPEAVATVGALSPVVRPNVVREEAFEALQERVAALEAIVIEMGHGQALRDARSDASASTRRSRVAPLSDMLNDLHNNAAPEEPISVKKEKAAIDQVIESLLSGSSDV